MKTTLLWQHEGWWEVLELIVSGKLCQAFEKIWWKAEQMWDDRGFTLTEIHVVPWGRKSVIKTWPICGCQTRLSSALVDPFRNTTTQLRMLKALLFDSLLCLSWGFSQTFRKCALNCICILLPFLLFLKTKGVCMIYIYFFSFNF